MVRISEWLNLICFSFFILMAWLRQQPNRRRFEIIAFGISGIIMTFAGIIYSLNSPSFAATLFRDLLPAPLMLFVYWQSGRFDLKPNVQIQNALLRLDNKLIAHLLARHSNFNGRSWFAKYLEFAYLICYLLVPLGVGALYKVGEQRCVDNYWVIVLISTYLCYLPLPFIQMLPPRMLTSQSEQMHRVHGLRVLNLGILKHASIQVNTFPSAHVASTTAAALALFFYAPAVGISFLIVALSIAASAVLGRYHYAADAVLGIIVAVVVAFISPLITGGPRF